MHELRECYFSMNMLSSILRSNLYKSYEMRHLARFVGNDKIVNLDSGTLTGRILSYLKPEVNESTVKTETIRPEELLSMIRYTSPDQINISNSNIVHLINSLEDEALVKSNRGFFKILKSLDDLSYSRRREMNMKQILRFLDAYMDLVPHRITELKFYKAAIDHLYMNLDNLKGKDYMKFIFYVSLMKKNIKYQKVLRKTLSLLKDEQIDQLSSEELCIIANSTFKTSTKLNKKILQKIKSYLSDNLMLLRDPAVFVTLIKCLRFNRYCDEDLLSTISCAIFFNKSFENYTFQTYCHILALYSDNLYYDEKLLEFISKKCLEELRNYSHQDIGPKKIRTKDLVRFLWGMSNLNANFFEEDDMDVILSVILGFLKAKSLDFKALIEMFWYLWILNHKSHLLIPFIQEKKDEIDKLPENSTTRQKINQLLVCIYHEDRPLFDKLKLKPYGKSNFVLNQHLKNRPSLENVFRSLRIIGKKRKMRFELNYQIPHMNILGIIGYEKNIYKAVNIEVLDHFTTLKNSVGRPTGLMQIKLRILDGLEEALIVVKENEIDDFTESKLEKFLDDELNLVC